MMDALSYKAEFDRIVLLAQLAHDIDVNGLRANLEYLETLGPMLAPSEWMYGGSRNLQDQRVLLEGFIPFWHAANKLKALQADRVAEA